MDKEQELADIVKNGVRSTRVMLPKNYPEYGLLRQVPKVIFENELRTNNKSNETVRLEDESKNKCYRQE